MRNFLFVISVLMFVSNVAIAEEVKDIADRVIKLDQDKKYGEALTELGWLRKEIEKKYSLGLTSLLPDTLEGYTGEKAETNNALGMMNVERKYKGPGDAKVTISVLGGGPGGAAQGLGGGLAAIGQMAAMFGQQQGQDVFRIKGMTASLSTDSGNPELTVFLTGGSMLKLAGEDSDTLKKMAEAIDVAKITTYMNGVS
ncbi:MAG: hypothetical protein SGJ02_00155 [bacterium]|nr:hypothetical protein [bacterium]